MKFSGCKRLATEISSSMVSQWIPIPPPISSQPARCFCVASSKRGNQAIGAATVRPSVRTTVNVSSEQRTSIARASFRSAKVLIPLLQEKLSILNNDLSKFRNFVTSEAARISERNRGQPKFRVPFCLGDVNMSRLLPFHAEKEKPVSTYSQQHRHDVNLPQFGI